VVLREEEKRGCILNVGYQEDHAGGKVVVEEMTGFRWNSRVE
jgi:hypothetical protein